MKKKVKSALKAKMKSRKELRQSAVESFKYISVKNGAYSIAAIAVAVAIAIIINLIVSNLPSDVKQFDISDNDIYEISDVSREILKELEQDITVTVVAETDSVDERLNVFLEKYCGLSKHIKLETVDPVLHPSALTEYETESDTVIVSSEETGLSVQIPISDILVESMSYYYTGSGELSSFDGDGQLTSAISQVMGMEQKKIYCITDHGESSLSSSITGLLSKSGFQTEEYSLMMSGEIPEDCDMLLINGVAADISEDDANMLDKYIKNGGHVSILISEGLTESSQLESLMKKYGITLENGYIADMERNYQNNYYYIFPNVTATGELSQNMTTGMVLLANSRGFTLGDSSESLYAESLLETSSNGYAVSEDSEKQGTFATAARVTYTAAETSEDEDEASEVVKGSLTVYGSASIIDEGITEAFSGLDNSALFINSITANFEDVENLSIEAKSLEVQYNTPQYGSAFSIMVIFILPACIVIYGFVVWRRRRKA